MCNDEMMQKPEDKKCHHHHHDDCMHKGPHGHGPHGHGPHGGPMREKMKLMHALPADSIEGEFFKTFHKLMHSSAEDIKNQVAFAGLSNEEKQQLSAILKKIDAAIKEEPRPEPKEAPAQSETDQTQE